jgi:hypothetical protein
MTYLAQQLVRDDSDRRGNGVVDAREVGKVALPRRPGSGLLLKPPLLHDRGALAGSPVPLLLATRRGTSIACAAPRTWWHAPHESAPSDPGPQQRNVAAPLQPLPASTIMLTPGFRRVGAGTDAPFQDLERGLYRPCCVPWLTRRTITISIRPHSGEDIRVTAASQRGSGETRSRGRAGRRGGESVVIEFQSAKRKEPPRR